MYAFALVPVKELGCKAMTKNENNTVDQQLCQLCATDTSHNTLMVEGVSECYYRVATRQDVEIVAGMRVMDGRNTTAENLKLPSKIINHISFLLKPKQGKVIGRAMTCWRCVKFKIS